MLKPSSNAMADHLKADVEYKIHYHRNQIKVGYIWYLIGGLIIVGGLVAIVLNGLVNAILILWAPLYFAIGWASISPSKKALKTYQEAKEKMETYDKNTATLIQETMKDFAKFDCFFCQDKKELANTEGDVIVCPMCCPLKKMSSVLHNITHTKDDCSPHDLFIVSGGLQ